MTEKLLGFEVFIKNIDYTKIRKNQLKQFVKRNKKNLELNINITGLKKKELIIIVDQILINSQN